MALGPRASSVLSGPLDADAVESAWDPSWVDAPIFAPLRGHLAPLRALDRWPDPEFFDGWLGEACARASVPIHRVEPCPPKSRKRPAWRGLEFAYDARIAELAQIPTRQRDWHDLMNLVAWVSFPRAKRALHLRQFLALREEVAACEGRRPKRRGRLRDLLTILDEAGCWVGTSEASARQSAREADGDPPLDPNSAWVASSTRREDALAGAGRSSPRTIASIESRSGAIVFGHALLEQRARGQELAQPLWFRVPAGTGGLEAAHVSVRANGPRGPGLSALDRLDLALSAWLERASAEALRAWLEDALLAGRQRKTTAAMINAESTKTEAIVAVMIANA